MNICTDCSHHVEVAQKEYHRDGVSHHLIHGCTHESSKHKFNYIDGTYEYKTCETMRKNGSIENCMLFNPKPLSKWQQFLKRKYL